MEFKVPELGEGVHEGELLKWKVKAGDVIKDDQILCEVMTDKATIEIPAPFSGKITGLNAKEGEIIHVNQVIVTYEGKAGATANAAPAASASPAPSPKAPAPAPVHGGGAPMVAASAPSPAGLGAMVNSDPATRVLAAPSTRRMAREMGVDLRTVQASGPAGRVMREDLQRAGGTSGVPSMAETRGAGAVAGSAIPAYQPYQAPRMTAVAGASEERVPIRGLRKKISEKMRLSKDRAAHFTYVEEADATELVKLRNQSKELGAQYGIKVTYLPFVMKAIVAALRKYPHMNSNIDDASGELIVKSVYNIGLSIQTEDGLTAPVVKDVGSKTVLTIAKEIQGLVDRARARKLTQDDFSGGTITLTNAGSIGGLFATPIINYPEVAIVGLNKIFKKPVVKTVGQGASAKDEIVVRDWTYFSISLDHRVIDGAVAAEFMKTMIQYIENPSLLLLDSI